MQLHIQILPRQRIHTERWNQCVAEANHSNIFMYSWALDALCTYWDGLIINDYEAVLPLPWRQKWGIKYLYQVPFMPRLSVMGANWQPTDSPAVLQAMQQHFSFIHTDIDNLVCAPWATRSRTNLYLPLSHTYATLEARFTEACRKNIRKATARGCQLAPANRVEDIILMYDNAYGGLQNMHTQRNYQSAIAFAHTALQHQKASMWQVEQQLTHEPLYTAILLHDKHRIYYWLGAPTAQGRQCRATYFFISQIIQQYSQSQHCFDFEGSDIPSVAHFYQQFAPLTETYHQVKWHRLQWLLSNRL